MSFILQVDAFNEGRSSHLGCSIKKDEACKFIEGDFYIGVFLWIFAKFLDTSFKEHLLMAASVKVFRSCFNTRETCDIIAS